ncbi:DUF2652 domain-containing protein [Hymenobacter jeollabukensis]|uniref:DUF2652 domain-containing protein n=1 Tax=Hymenobacter jeollabukensis TaxID=2025313 RepID=A0A5R8WSM7_9BACT|nr:DUF2652 domain-containing protein [Hymenobacter jeollabukensis]TLM94191.1 DUF2652 domain-containing protein [Hymenobacter jeollabukensis]
MGLLDDLRAARRAAGRRHPAAPGHAAADDTQPALLLIPDISGFTRFIAEAHHPQAPHLVADLLEILIEANCLNLEVAEIQGDAILFYRLGEPPPVAELVEQCRRIFLDFQNYLQLVARDTNSELAAALHEAGLTLKIIGHYGRVSVADIREFRKLLGRDVIVAHRLLKNNVVGSEYVLLTEGYLNTQQPAEVARCFAWTRLQPSATRYDYLGDIRYFYAYLTPLRLLVQAEIDQGKLPVTCRVLARRTVAAPLSQVLRVVSNLRLRPRWLAGTTAVHYDVTKAHRPGANYKLDLYAGQIDLQVVQRLESDGHTEYVEKVAHWRLFPNALLFFRLEVVDDQHCLVTMEFRYGHVASAHRLIRKGQLQRLQRWLGQSVRQLAALFGA